MTDKDSMVTIEMRLTDAEIVAIAMVAHHKGVTMNDFIVSAATEYLCATEEEDG